MVFCPFGATDNHAGVDTIVSVWIRNESHQGDPTMRPHRVRFTIRGLMIAVLVVAVLLSMPIRDLILLILCTTVLAIMFCCAYQLAIMTQGWRGHSHAGRYRNLECVIHSWRGPSGEERCGARNG